MTVQELMKIYHISDQEAQAILDRQQKQAELEKESSKSRQQLAARKEKSESELRAKSEAHLRATLEEQFFEVNPNASPTDFERLFPQMRDDLMLENLRQKQSVVEEERKWLYKPM